MTSSWIVSNKDLQGFSQELESLQTIEKQRKSIQTLKANLEVKSILIVWNIILQGSLPLGNP